MRLFYTLVLALIGAACSPNQDPTNGAYQAVYRITNEAGTSGGTGFRLKSGFIITNDHVCAIASSGQIYTHDFKGSTAISTVVNTDRARDLCLLSPQPNPYSLDIASKGVSHFQAIYIVGHPFLEDARWEKGIFISNTVGTFGDPVEPDGTCKNGSEPQAGLFTQYCLRSMMLSTTNARGFPGNSGSPVLNEDGNVVGVMNSGNPRSNNAAYVPYESLRSFLLENPASLR